MISLIVAMDKNRVIGSQNDIPWHLPDDLKYFKKKTLNKSVIMGRKNWESLPHKFRPLPNRFNIIVTRNQDFQANNATTSSTIEEAIQQAQKHNDASETFIIGGGDIYRLAMPYVQTMYITEVHAVLKGDTTFPIFSDKEWTLVSKIYHPRDELHQYSFDFLTYQKTKQE